MKAVSASADSTTTTSYLLEGSRIIFQTVGSTRWSFLYYGDELTGFEVEGETYYYLKNLQGDIFQIVDEDGEIVVEYLYDDWGKLLSIEGELSDTVGEENPFRYRGYVYDEETGLYYVSSRYYDPETGRFINADEIDYLGADGSLTSYNLFVYCNNNPINCVDKTGCSPFGVLQLNDYWIIHKIIQFLCCAEYGLSMGGYVKGRLGVGFLDLYDQSTHQYYEVKSSSAAKRTRTQLQMVKYDHSLISDKRFEDEPCSDRLQFAEHSLYQARLRMGYMMFHTKKLQTD